MDSFSGTAYLKKTDTSNPSMHQLPIPHSAKRFYSSRLSSDLCTQALPPTQTQNKTCETNQLANKQGKNWNLTSIWSDKSETMTCQFSLTDWSQKKAKLSSHSAPLHPFPLSLLCVCGVCGGAVSSPGLLCKSRFRAQLEYWAEVTSMKSIRTDTKSRGLAILLGSC